MVSLKDILQLSIPERILMVETIWNSIEREAQAGIPLTEVQQEELIIRMERYERGESRTYSWEELMCKLKGEK